MLRSNSKSDCEVAVIGAGPYGLAVAAHLKGAKVDTHIFGDAMSFWRNHMPKGMTLRSELGASDIAAPRGALSLQAYADEKGIRLAYPLPLEHFIGYGRWFQAHAAPDLDGRKVVRVEAQGDRFRLTLSDGDHMVARRVVMATGLDRHEFRPSQFRGLPQALVSHACEHADLGKFAGRRVAIVGRGQSGTESAAILHEVGAEVELIARGEVRWLGSDSPDTGKAKDMKWQLRELLATKSGVGPFPFNWPAEYPDFVRQMPPAMRTWFNARCLRPAAASWLKPRLAGVTVTAGRTIVGARVSGSRVAVHFDQGAAEFDHVLLATGYRIDVAKYPMLAPDLVDGIRSENGSPVLTTGFESTVPGLHFVGASSVKSYGPLMRFVAGSDYAARHLTQALVSRRMRRRPASSRNAAQPMMTQGH